MTKQLRWLGQLLWAMALGGCSGQTAAPPAAPAISLAVAPKAVEDGQSASVNWSAAGATSCTAAGAWSGPKPPEGSARTLPLHHAINIVSIRCEGPGGVSRSAEVVNVAGGVQQGLDFPGVEAAGGTIRFRFANPLKIYPATYIWQVKLRSQPHYYTTFFWGNDGEFQWDTVGYLNWKRPTSNTYYGAHPYPFPSPNYVRKFKGTVGPRFWEIAVDGLDVLSKTEVEYGRWHTQSLRVWADHSGKHHEFYWDLPDTTRVIKHTVSSSYGNDYPPNPTLTWGDAPWAPGKEVMHGVIRGIQIYSDSLPIPALLTESSTPLKTPEGRSALWYINLDPTPTDLSDHSSNGKTPEWVGPLRPALWEKQK